MTRALKLNVPAEPDWTPEGFTLVDVFALKDDEHALVAAMFEHHTGAQNCVMDDLVGLDIPVMRAREIILSTALVIAGIHATEMRIPHAVMGAAAVDARTAAEVAVAIGADVQGVG